MEQLFKEAETKLVKAVKGRDYYVIKTGAHTVTFEACGFEFSFWMANGEYGYDLYNEGHCVYFEISKESAVTIGRILQDVYTEGLLKNEIAKHQEQIAKLEEQLRSK